MLSRETFVKKVKHNNIRSHYVNKYKAKKMTKDIYLHKGFYDIIQRIMNNLFSRTHKVFTQQKIKSQISIRDLLGCTNNELKKHLEKLFTDGMNFKNYGEWEVGHVTPIASFDLKLTEQQLECFNYKNLQPLWKEDNLKKSDKLDW